MNRLKYTTDFFETKLPEMYFLKNFTDTYNLYVTGTNNLSPVCVEFPEWVPM